MAGNLIRMALTPASGGYRRPPVPDHAAADYFQEVLIEAFDTVRDAHDGGIVLDGHFVIPTADGPRPVGLDVFSRLNATHVALVDVEPNVAARRLRKRDAPLKWWGGDLDDIRTLVELERRQARLVARRLGCSLAVLDGEDAVIALAHSTFETTSLSPLALRAGRE